ncbi:gamma-tubulin complex DGRIP91/SPC98 component [Auriscalpium vulgare]|uniref:Gamma-tubulin complex DGRIP91/SPC98 component n=1 Tax=Auriscalpium vulgare TaxID=40419 RepID=A0ACB8SCE4_9AGAM|nr:gamma-tubulin complex DGRIP91/SPC98 component [Auriscalpium vulgare]
MCSTRRRRSQTRRPPPASAMMSPTTSSLETLVYALVPQARNNDPLKNDIMAHCKDVLSSHIGQSREKDVGHLADIVKRHLMQTRSDGIPSLQFTNLLSRLLEQPVLSRKYDSLLFLHSLASSPRTPSIAPSYLPSLAPPPPLASHTRLSPADAVPAPRLPKGKSKAELLREFRVRSGRPHLSEEVLIRDTLYLLQGISGKHIRFSAADHDGVAMKLVFSEDAGHLIPAPTKELIHRLSEVGHLYTLVDHFVRDRESLAGIGMIEQSLFHHLQSQLTEYYRLIAVLESQLTLSSSSNESSGTPADPDLRAEESGLTLKRLDVWINEWRLRMRMMSVCVEAARDTHGGALVNLIHSYTENGDPFVREFTDQLLEEVSKPFFGTLQKWLFSGDLYDPFSEFFVLVDPELAHLRYVQPSALAAGYGALSGDGGFSGLSGDNDEVSDERESGLRLWEAKYQFRSEMLPTFVGEGFGRKIFSTGKSLNFIRYSCQDNDWVATRDKLNKADGTLQYSDISGLERSIDAAYRIASQRLFDVFFEKFRLLDHFRALKNYLLLGHGDFADQLMEALGPSLSRPANTLYRHNLTATLETAIRSSNAQKDPADVLRRLDARMLEYTHGEIGWDVFTLEYKVDAPLDTVLDPDSMIKYLKLFNHLWKMKRIESSLARGWMRTGSGTKSFVHIPELEPEWHRIRLSMAEMVHFIRQMEAYCQLEVIECSWKALMDFVHKKEGDLDALIASHKAYLDRMVKKVLLIGQKAGREESLLNQVREAFSTIIRFQEATDNFYNFCLTESARRDSDRDSTRGVFTGGESQRSQEPLLRSLRQCKDYGLAFSEQVQAIVHSLQSHVDLDCRFLGIRLSFSDFYRSKRDFQSQSRS